MTLPSESRTDPGLFDRFAAAADRFSSRAWYFTLCVLIVILWACTYPLWKSGDTWQLVINTGTTILTFWMVALQRNADRRDAQSSTEKQNAQLLATKWLVETVVATLKLEPPGDILRQLDDAIGLEEHTTA
jgi:low affinity Fe/Cu permease